MRQGKSSSFHPSAPTGSASRVSLDLVGPDESISTMPPDMGPSCSHLDAAEARHELDTGHRAEASSAASSSAVATGVPPTTGADTCGRGLDGNVSGWASAISKEALWVLGIVVALCLLLVALVYLNLSHRAGM
ncbi:uncharacterized protein [Dermacentor albipictus]|uniref:uncharacterized protein isoform X2 n=1 Tax=Dermacentor albipictus TaxID=60249 RepID=UPI0031FDA868